jgi:hypothetical protein
MIKEVSEMDTRITQIVGALEALNDILKETDND